MSKGIYKRTKEHCKNISKGLRKRHARREILRKTSPKFVYLLHCEGTSYYKIGVTQYMSEERIARMQVYCPHKQVIMIESFFLDSFQKEAKLHSKFRQKHFRGEWFELDDKEVEEILSELRMCDELIEQ